MLANLYRDVRELVCPLKQVRMEQHVSARWINAGDKAGAPFRAGREAVRMFLRGPFVFVFFQAINAGRSELCGVRSDVYWRFISGFCPIRSNQGRSGQSGHYMQFVQSRINTGDFASC